MVSIEKEITVLLSPPAKRHIAKQVAAGRSATAQKYILELIEEDRRLAAEEKALLKAIDVGLRDIREGRVKTYPSPAALAADVKRRGMRRLKKSRG